MLLGSATLYSPRLYSEGQSCTGACAPSGTLCTWASAYPLHPCSSAQPHCTRPGCTRRGSRAHAAGGTSGSAVPGFHFQDPEPHVLSEPWLTHWIPWFTQSLVEVNQAIKAWS